MQKRNLFIVLAITLLVLMAACAEPEPEEVEVTREVEVPQTVEVTQEVTRQVTEVVREVVTDEVEVTRLVTAEPSAVPTASVSGQEEFAANYVATQEQGGVVIELSRVLCMSRQRMIQEFEEITDETFERDLGGAVTSCEFILTVENTADSVRNVYPDQGDVVIGNEQIDLLAQSIQITDLEAVSGELQPGVVRIGGFWFGVKRSKVDEIDQMTYIVDPPSDADYNRRGSEFRFEFGTEGWGFEPWPGDL